MTNELYGGLEDVILEAHGPDGLLPLVIEPWEAGLDLTAWLAGNAARVDALLDRHGALVLRRFDLRGAADFARAAAAIAPDVRVEPSGADADPADRMVPFHNEGANRTAWPLRTLFLCLTPPRRGGATALVDGRALCRLLDREILDAFWDRCLLYVRTFTPGIDVPWQTFFGTSDPEAVEQACRAAGQRCEWTGSGALRVSRRGPGVVVHPRTGETTFFNEVQLHHVGRLDAETGGALRRLYGDGDLPRDVRFGDGSPIPDRFMERVATACDALAVDLEWQAGDVLVLDNLLVAHARRPYAGRYRVLTATGHLVRPGDVRQVSSCPLAPSL